MAFPIPNRVKRIWDEWNLRAAILISLFLQIVLIFSAASRKRTGNKIVAAIIWSFYLLADWFAAFAVGLISNGQSNDCPDKFRVNEDLAAFWAPFLLLHLGGPDNITAFSLEDNELWLRHLLGLVIQLLAVAYVFSQSIPNAYSVSTILLFFAGAIKYAERTRALYLACLGNFKSSVLPKPDAGPNYAQLMEEYSSKEDAGVPVRIEIVKEHKKDSQKTADEEKCSHLDNLQNAKEAAEVPVEKKINDLEIVKNGYDLFTSFRGFIVDHMFSFHERDKSREFFFRRTAIDAFKVMEVELNFMYDMLYTKMAVVHHKLGYLLRLICSVLLVVSFEQFAYHHKGNVYHFDVAVTYVLLSGAVLLDFVAVIKLTFCDWTIVSVTNVTAKTIVSTVREWLSFDQRCRWSNQIAQHNLIKYCLKKRWRWLDLAADTLGLKDLLDEMEHKDYIPIKEDLKKFIFDELKVKAQKAKDTKAAKEIYSAKGNWALSCDPCYYPFPSISSSVSEEAEYDESLLLWHIATELCYCTSPDDNNPNRDFCKLISDYMLYLLVMRPTMMSAVGGIGQIRYQDTCEEAKKFFSRGNPRESPYERLLNVNTVVKPIEVKGDRSKSVLFDACRLAEDLKRFEDDSRWKIMSKVWVELLSYGASHCRANAHVQQLSKGGELITFVWLLMAHFGLGEQFRIEAGHARAKLIVKK